MKVLDAIARIMKKEGVAYLSAYPTTALIESAAEIGIQTNYLPSGTGRGRYRRRLCAGY